MTIPPRDLQTALIVEDHPLFSDALAMTLRAVVGIGNVVTADRLEAVTRAGIAVPPGFVPIQDKYYLVAIAQLPNSASLDRTDAVAKQMSKIALAEPGVESVVAFPGLSINGFVNVPNAAVLFFMLDPFKDRTTPDLNAMAIAGRLQAKFASIPDGFLGVFPPPPVPGLGATGGFKMLVEDRSGAGLDALVQQTQILMTKATESGQVAGLLTSLDVNAPQLDVAIDRTQAQSQGVRLDDVFESLQVYLGSLYVNDFNRFGRTYKVTAQADADHRMQAEAIGRLQVRNAAGDMLLLSSFVTVTPSSGPDRVIHYNGYPSADISGGAMAGVPVAGTMAGLVGAWPVDGADGLRPPSLPTGASTAEGSSICFMLDIIVPVSPRTNGCPEKPGAAQPAQRPASSTARP